MPPLTLEVIALLITGIVGPLLVGAFSFWKMIQGKIAEAVQGVHADIQDLKDDHRTVEGRVHTLEKDTVSKEDHSAAMQAINTSISAVAIALRETGATLTSRIDLVLFEVGRHKKDG